ncbi:MAG TPA: zinc-ribbon domain-containing protein, partial [Polyangia bacterium]|nr:zinc-ribbon domain-containing protein [Polyangia bacterium]
MKFVCDRCQTKYSIADEKVRGKILKVRCKSCSNIITVRDEAASASAAA